MDGSIDITYMRYVWQKYSCVKTYESYASIYINEK